MKTKEGLPVSAAFLFGFYFEENALSEMLRV